jgi:V/A-type H+/Na+-transporting ATPase subunit K
MKGRGLSRSWSAIVFLAVMLAPAVAQAAETTSTASDVGVGTGIKTVGAALAMGLSAIGAGIAQGRIGSAGQGTLAERPEERVWILALTALPEIIVLLGFVMAIMLSR